MSLSDALRAAALERARRSGENIDGIVLEPSGVIDLREMARAAGRETDRRIKLPMLTGRAIDDRAPDESLTETALWRRLRPVTPQPDGTPIDLDLTTPEPTGPAAEPELAELDPTLFDDLALTEDDVAGFENLTPTGDDPVLFEPVEIDLTDRPEHPSVFERNDATLADETGRPMAVCDHCGSFGQSDLYDRFSRTEYYSCDDCGHMWQQSITD